MAIHTDLPIYKVAYDLLITTTSLVKNMPRDFKASIGAKLRDECVEIMVLIFRANSTRNKTPYLDNLIERVQVADLLFRVARDSQSISIPQYASAIKLTGAVGRQAGGWRNSQRSPDASVSRHQ